MRTSAQGFWFAFPLALLLFRVCFGFGFTFGFGFCCFVRPLFSGTRWMSCSMVFSATGGISSSSDLSAFYSGFGSSNVLWKTFSI